MKLKFLFIFFLSFPWLHALSQEKNYSPEPLDRVVQDLGRQALDFIEISKSLSNPVEIQIAAALGYNYNIASAQIFQCVISMRFYTAGDRRYREFTKPLMDAVMRGCLESIETLRRTTFSIQGFANNLNTIVYFDKLRDGLKRAKDIIEPP